jgi:hypothetical protein
MTGLLNNHAWVWMNFGPVSTLAMPSLFGLSYFRIQSVTLILSGLKTAYYSRAEQGESR